MFSEVELQRNDALLGKLHTFSLVLFVFTVQIQNLNVCWRLFSFLSGIEITKMHLQDE